MATTGLFAPKRAPRACVYFVFDVQPIHSGEPERMNCPHWLLALTIPFSRSDRAHTYLPVLMPGARRTVSGRKPLAGESPSVAGGPGRPFRRVCHIIRRASERQRVRAGRMPTGQRPCAGRPQQFYRS
jgi:hypothetical protein